MDASSNIKLIISSNMCAKRTPIRHMTSKWKFTGRVPPPPVNLRKTASTAGELCVCCGVSVANNRRFVSKVCHICYHLIFCDAIGDATRDAIANRVLLRGKGSTASKGRLAPNGDSVCCVTGTCLTRTLARFHLCTVVRKNGDRGVKKSLQTNGDRDAFY